VGTGPSFVEPDGCPSVSLPAPDLDVDHYGSDQLGSHVGLKGGPRTVDDPLSLVDRSIIHLMMPLFTEVPVRFLDHADLPELRVLACDLRGCLFWAHFRLVLPLMMRQTILLFELQGPWAFLRLRVWC
jgi:hypothetical protein